MSTEPIDTERVRAKVKPWLQSVTLEDGALFPEEQDYLIVTCLRLCDEIDRLRANDEFKVFAHIAWSDEMSLWLFADPNDEGAIPVYVTRSTSEPTARCPQCDSTDPTICGRSPLLDPHPHDTPHCCPNPYHQTET